MLPFFTHPMVKEWFTPRDAAGLTGLPETPQGMSRWIKREKPKTRLREGRGGGVEIHVSSFPWETREFLARQILEQDLEPLPESTETLPETLPATGQAPAPTKLLDIADWQRKKMGARKAILLKLAQMEATMGIGPAINELIRLAREKALPENLQVLIPVANGSNASGKHTLSRSTLFVWRKAALEGNTAIAPKPRPEKKTYLAWSAELLKRYRHPSRPTLSAVLRDMKDDGFQPVPTYRQAHFYLQTKVGAIERLRGRLSPKELKAKLPFVRRDTSNLVPTMIYNLDGHTWCSLVAHPNTGKPFSPEVTSAIDVATRRLVGFSTGVSESSEVVIDALINAVQTGGVMAVLQMDSGSGNKNTMMEDAVAGIQPRIGFEIYRAAPGNSQGGGIIERYHQTLVEAAKKMPTFVGKRDTHPELRREVGKKLGAGKLQLPTMADLVALIQKTIKDYNNRPHRELPKIRDHVTGSMRHQTPNEAWQQHVDEGCEFITLDDDELVQEFRPEKVCTVRRGEVLLFGLLYFSKHLNDFNDQEVRVKYDIRDGAKVWISTMANKPICEAMRNANHKPYLGSVLDVGVEKRLQSKIRRLDAKKEKAIAESKKTLELAAQPPSQEIVEISNQQLKKMGVLEPLPELEPIRLENNVIRPNFKGTTAEADWGRWVLNNFDQVPQTDRARFFEEAKNWNFRTLVGVTEEEIKNLKSRKIPDSQPAQALKSATG
ncbi:MAG: Mu transposase C-terminal domain-containing protein [Magnetococcus sp. DMHC-1]|nr:transposase [Magnetococcales bacterium]